MFNTVITTAKKFEESNYINGTSLIDTTNKKGDLKNWQTVIAVGNHVTSVKPGDVVMINPERYAVKKYSENSLKNDLLTNKVVSYDFKTITINNEQCLVLSDVDIMYILEEFEEIEEEPKSSIDLDPMGKNKLIGPSTINSDKINKLK